MHVLRHHIHHYNNPGTATTMEIKLIVKKPPNGSYNLSKHGAHGATSDVVYEYFEDINVLVAQLPHGVLYTILWSDPPT